MADSVIKRDPKILGGTPIFSGTRVPVRILWDHLKADIPLDDFLDNYPTVSREQAVAVLESAAGMLLDNSRENFA